MTFKLDDIEYEIINIFNKNDNNYLLYKEINKEDADIYAARFVLDGKNIELKDIETEEEWKLISEECNIGGEK